MITKYNKKDIENLDRIFRINLMNSITGIKPANLIATKSEKGVSNVAIFSSVVHLGSNPAQIGFFIRPQYKYRTDTFSNIKDTGFFTINHIHGDIVRKSHYTSAKLPSDISEFDRIKIKEEYIDGFFAPFVKSSFIKIGLSLIKLIELPNRCTLVIGEVDLIKIKDKSIITEEGRVDIKDAGSIGVAGLDRYYKLSKEDEFEYIGNDEIPEFE